MNEENTQALEVIAPSALESIERANVDMQIATARRYPRSLSVVKQRMMNLATLDEETAESCFYKLNRQGKAIEGPSIRLAEIAASSFGNLRYGARVIGNDGKTITAQGFCHDLETNVLCTIETQRRITDRNGQTYGADMQVVTGNAACAIAARNSIFKVVPFAFVKPIYLAAKQTAVGDITTLADRRAKMLTKFAALGVDQKRLCASVGKGGVEEIGLAELETLIGVYSGIRDNEQTVDEAFPEPKKASADIQFGPAGIDPALDEQSEKPKRKRRTKAEMEAAKQDLSSDENRNLGKTPSSSEDSAQTNTETSVDELTTPAQNSPIEALRAQIAASPLNEEQVVRYFVSAMALEPHQKLDDLAESQILAANEKFMDIAKEILGE